MTRTSHSSSAAFAVLSLLLVMSILPSCEKVEERDPCLQPRTVSLRMGAYKRAADTGVALTDTALPRVTLFPIGGRVAFSYPATSKFSLFLSPHADSSSFVIQTDTVIGSPLDTITFRYVRKTQFLSNACGYTYFFTLRSVTATSNRLDSARINSFDVTNDANPEHVQLFYAR